ncbi:MAG TPA: response regulator transcription factor [Solirubrobacteraceae bacterium]|nr:response regulator transcription factor [Solirubrobacteraceae bacterium]
MTTATAVSATPSTASGERAPAAGPRGAWGSSTRGRDLIVLDQRVLDRRVRDRVPGDHPPVVRVLLADGDRLVRAGLRELLKKGSGIQVAGEAANGRGAVALARQLRPDVVLMSVRLPDMDGVEATRRITARPGAEVEVLLLTENERDADVLAALRAGASGVLTMDTEPAELLRAVRALAGGSIEFSPSVTLRLIDTFISHPQRQRSTPRSFEGLTAREREVVALVALGLSNDEIGDRLVVSPATAKTHVSRAMTKLDVRDRAKLVALAYQTGFVRLHPDRLSTEEPHRPVSVAHPVRAAIGPISSTPRLSRLSPVPVA